MLGNVGQGFGGRAKWGAAVVALAAAGTLTVGGDPQTVVLALAGGLAAVLLAASRVDEAAPAPAAGATVEPLLAPVLDAVAEPVLLIADGTVALANRAARALLGQHIVGEDARVAIRHPAATERLAAAEVDERPVELIGLGPLEQRWQMRVSPVGDGRRLVHLTDRTQAHAAEQMRVDFVANASHELRTPLAAVLGFIETLEEADDEPTRTRFLQIMGNEAQRMQRLVEDLISLSRIEAEKYRLPAAAVDLAALIEEVQAELAGTSEARARDLKLQVEPGVPLVSGDRAQLSQVLHNLVGNAMKYGRAGTPVAVTLGRDGGLVRLVVADQGEGIAAEHLPRLTERFYRVDTGRSRSLGGTGLGLAIVKHIVERHRGRLTIASRVGEGTTVTVTLPPLSADRLSSSGNARTPGPAE
jgi:two-component system phosphate regulon sensor histidine kinase PhoR